jgi:hypothetical protein
VAQDTGADGHPAVGTAVEPGVSTEHDVIVRNTPQPNRPFRCLRHHVWMAACDDCRKQHAPRVRRQKSANPAR